MWFSGVLCFRKVKAFGETKKFDGIWVLESDILLSSFLLMALSSQTLLCPVFLVQLVSSVSSGPILWPLVCLHWVAQWPCAGAGEV